MTQVMRRFIVPVCFGCACIIAVAMTFATRKNTVHAQSSSGPLTITATAGGVYSVGSQGSITFCSDQSTVTGTGGGATIVPLGKCVFLSSSVKLTPTTDRWTAAPVPGTNSVFYLDNTTGRLVQCTALLSAVVSIGTTYYLTGDCANYGDVTP